MRKKLIMPALFCTVLMSGCAKVNSMLEARILQESGIADDKNYQTYQQLLEEGSLDEEGLYNQLEIEETEEIPGDGIIHVTFATNSYIKVSFFMDETRIHPIAECYVNPGDSIYISEPIASHPVTNHYSMDGFRLVSYDSDHIITFDETVHPEADGSSIKIPDSFSGTELTVQPIGKYDNRVISISDYFVDEDGTKHELNGNWMIEEDVFRQTTAEINAAQDYDVEYHYDPEEYYIASTNPAAYSIDDKKGIVHFNHETANSETDRFEVEVHKWINVSLNGNTKKGVDSAFVAELPSEITDSSLKKVKCGDLLTLITKADYKATSNDMQMVGEPETLTEGFKTTFEVPQTSESQLSIVIGNKLGSFDIPSVTHGKITVKNANGSELKEGETIDGSTDVVVRITPDSGYYVSGKDVENDAYEKKMSFSKYQSDIDKIINEHKIIKFITVTLEEAGEHGSSAYKVGNKSASGKQTGLKIGQTIKVEYTLTDDKWSFKDDSGNVLDNINRFIQNTINKAKRTVDVKITAEMDGNTLNGEDYMDIVKRGQ